MANYHRARILKLHQALISKQIPVVVIESEIQDDPIGDFYPLDQGSELDPG